MKFNHKELGLISTHWNSTFEGILLLRQKSDTFFKRSGRTAFEEHWCRLKGNLLVILRTDDRHSSEVLGVVLLEQCTVSLSLDVGVQHAFLIEFNSSDPSLLLAARSAAEAKIWCGHIASSGISELSARRCQLREELLKITGKDPLDQLSQSIPAASIAANVEELVAAGLELSLSIIWDNVAAQQKVCMGFIIFVSIRDAGKSDWKVLAETEVENEESPTFLKAIRLIPEKYSKSSEIKFGIMEFEDPRSSASRVIGSAITTLDELSTNSCLQLIVAESDEINARGSLSLIVKIKKFSSTNERNPMDSHNYQLQFLCTNIITQNYVFHHILGEPLHVVEFMGESKLSFQMPIEYIKFLIKQDHLLYDSLSRTGISDTTLECLRRERLLGMKGIIERYELCLRALVDHSGSSFKRSTERNNAELDFVPTNLHVNRIGLLDSEGSLVSFHDITSVGAFSSAATRYKCRGLFQTSLSSPFETISSSQSYPSSFSSSDLNLTGLASRNPLTAAALQCECHPVGVAIKQIAEGADLVLRVRGDLADLKIRLQAEGQAGLLAERLEVMMKKIDKLFSIRGAACSLELSSMKNDYENLLQKLIQIADLEKIQTTALHQPQSSPFPAPHASLIAPKIDDLHRENSIGQIAVESNKLDKSLRATWERIEECLWTLVLNSVANFSTGETSLLPISSNILAEVSNLWDSLHYRHHAALCQALCASLTGLAVAVTHWTAVHWEQMIECGIPVHFEGLLSCFGEELNMLDTWAWATQFLQYWRVIVRPITLASSNLSEEPTVSSANNFPRVKITQYKECVFCVPGWVWKNMPSEYQTRGRLELNFHPYAFNVGINEQQTIAEKLERTGLQTTINTRGLADLQLYFDKYTRKFGAPGKTATKQDVCDVIGCLKHILMSNRSKPVEILELSSEISLALNAIRVTSCKSAKDRTAMSISLEQTRWLRDVEWMTPDSFTSALKCLRSTGLRLSNVEKNLGVRKYAFTRFQLLSFPKLYRPPLGTFSLHVQS